MLEKMTKLTLQERQELSVEFPAEDVYWIELDRVIEERCDELDAILEGSGYEIHHREYVTIAVSIFRYRVYFSKAE